VSYFVRSCWLISFFFTPIYMLTLIFLVYFGPKKATATTYKMIWNFQPLTYFTLLYNTYSSTLNDNSFSRNNTKFIVYNTLSRFQYTVITAQPTVYVLLAMWLFFYSFGNVFLSLMFNYNTLTDTIVSGCFTYIKTHTIFMSLSSNLYLGDTLFIFIVFLFLSAFFFLMNLRLTFNYHYFRLNYFTEIFFVLLTGYLFFL
jgi:hypothetical protein